MRKVVFDHPPIINILYQDDYLVVIDKPSGLLVHRSEIDRHETLFAMQLTRDTIGQHVYPIHRLDRPTSGVLVFALNSEIARLMSEQMQAHTIQKKYQAIVRGYSPEQVRIDHDLKEILDKKSDKHKNNQSEPQAAITLLSRLATSELPYSAGKFSTARYSLVELTPITGRKHQLRRHMAHLRHPIIGDTTHGDGKQNKAALQHLNLDRLALTAKSITFTHPVSQQCVKVTARLDDILRQTYNTMGWHEWIF